MQGEGEKCGETERCDEAKEMPDGDDELSLEVRSSKWGGGSCSAHHEVGV